jgi:hypothetical protein
LTALYFPLASLKTDPAPFALIRLFGERFNFLPHMEQNRAAGVSSALHFGQIMLSPPKILPRLV